MKTRDDATIFRKDQRAENRLCRPMRCTDTDSHVDFRGSWKTRTQIQLVLRRGESIGDDEAAHWMRVCVRTMPTLPVELQSLLCMEIV